ncbi:hypothetical protein FGO68_gene15952 [Halteria grandinella]|uniref:Uncharacterized protein n=1 Tax=Halteria grandinella TaxID=5974 RepID=A0A8J8T813_HALGN|nr:hypothetical protein FGO68_gene15952 [Halteria grandinella]
MKFVPLYLYISNYSERGSNASSVKLPSAKPTGIFRLVTPSNQNIPIRMPEMLAVIPTISLTGIRVRRLIGVRERRKVQMIGAKEDLKFIKANIFTQRAMYQRQ